MLTGAAAGPDPPDPLLGRTVGGHYAIETRIGAGAMGVVYRARHTLLDREFALKALAPQYAADEQVRRRFVAEARCLVAIEHPGVVRVRHFFEEERRLFLVMDLCAGETLARVLAREGRLDLARAAGIALQILEALDAVHWGGIVHRDLKPANVMIRSVDGEDEVRLLDFGLVRIVRDDARAPDAIRSAAGAVIGTPLYMSPEQLRGAPDVDRRSDLFAVGIVLHEMLSGAHPFGSDSSVSTAVGVLEREPDSLPASGPRAVPAGVRAVLLRALAKDRGERYGSAESFAEDLRRALAGLAPSPRGSARDTAGAAPAAGPRRAGRTVVWISAAAVAGALAVTLVLRGDEIETARAGIEADPWAARDEARRIRERVEGDPARAARATLVEAAAVARIRSLPVVRTADDVRAEDLPLLARAWRLACGTDAEPEALEALGRALVAQGRPTDATQVLDLLRRRHPSSDAALRSGSGYAAALLSLGRVADARAVLAEPPQPSDEAQRRIARLADDLSPVLAIGSPLRGAFCIVRRGPDAADWLAGGAESADGSGAVVLAALREGTVLEVARTTLRSGQPQSLVAWRPAPAGPLLLSVVCRDRVRTDPTESVETFEIDGEQLVPYGDPVRVADEARLFPMDLPGDGRMRLLVCHVCSSRSSVSLLETAEGARGLRARAVRLDLPEDRRPGSQDVFGAVLLGDGRLLLATGYWGLYGAAVCTVTDGDPIVLRMADLPRGGDVESAASDGEGGAAWTSTHRAVRDPGLLSLLRDAPPPGIARTAPGEPERWIVTGPRGVARRGDTGSVCAERGPAWYGLTAWRRTGRLRWVAKSWTPTMGARPGVMVCVDDAPGATPVPLAFIPWSGDSTHTAVSADLDGDGADDLTSLDAGSGRLVVAGLRARGVSGDSAALPLPPTLGEGGAAGTARLSEVASDLASLGFEDEAADAWSEIVARGADDAETADALPRAVRALAARGRIEHAYRLLDGWRRATPVSRRVPQIRLALLEAELQLARGDYAAAAATADRAAALPGAQPEDAAAARETARRCRLAGTGREVRVPESATTRAALSGGALRVPLFPEIPVGRVAFSIRCSLRIDRPGFGCGVAIGVAGSEPPVNRGPLGEDVGRPFAGLLLSNQRLTPPIAALAIAPGSAIDAETFDMLPSGAFEPDDATAWVRIEVRIVPAIGEAFTSMSLDGRSETRHVRRVPPGDIAGHDLRLGAWIFRYGDDPSIEASGFAAEIRDVTVVVYD